MSGAGSPSRLTLALLMGLTLPALAGCTETVGFLQLRLEAPALDPPVTCDADPRHIHQVHFRLDCESERLHFSFETSANTVALTDIPLGDCTLQVEANNRHGRIVLSGQSSLNLTSGDAPPVTVQLVAEPCGASCDGDGDGIADDDERALGSDPSAVDSDHDGIDDGFELFRCCSDPKKKGDAKDCALGIQQIAPRVAVGGDTVLIKTSQLVENANVVLGDQPLQQFFTDPSTVLIGRVSRDAVLGALRVTAAGHPALPWPELFAVLQRAPEFVVDLDRQSGANAALMASVTDVATSGQRLYLLGSSGALGPGNQLQLPVLLRYDLAGGGARRLAFPRNGVTPVALSVRGGRVAIVGQSRDASGGRVIIGHLEESDLDAAQPQVQELELESQGAFALHLEADGRHAQVLLAEGLLRVDLTSSQTPKAIPLPTASAPGRQLSCTGIALRGSTSATDPQDLGYSYLACARRCSPGAPGGCLEQALLLRYGPSSSCFGTNAGAPGCWQVYPVPSVDDRPLGSPVVDAKARRVYLLTGQGGLFAAPYEPPLGEAPLLLLSPFKLGRDGSAPHPMVLDDDRGALFVVAGSRILRFEPRGSDPNPRRFPIAIHDQLPASMLALSGDDASLAVLRGGGPPSLATVCIERCATCACKPAP